MRRASPEMQRRVYVRLREIEADPYEARLGELLHGRDDGLRRSRVGDVRILYYVDDVVEVVDVTDIGPRGDVYKGR